ncbi:unnamed protein product [Paramecium sonneborni]|uniref:Transmembrane protein n=1 Tax=Paramecium sonneborni TaxID=65129 RepID=A0A8S1QA18_9CILI|nr:unnamed protein product [Paramecium sonneborni]
MILCLQTCFLLFSYIRKAKLCDPSTLEDCLLEHDRTIQLPLSGKSGYGYGFWSQYLSTDYILQANIKSYGSFEGLLLAYESDSNNKEARMLYYQDWTNNNTNQEKYIYFSTITNKKYQKAAKFIFDSFSFDGKWIYNYFACEFPNKRQVFLYVMGESYSGKTYQFSSNLSTQSIDILLKGRVKMIISSTEKIFIQYSGRISNLHINPSLNKYIFNTVNDFQSYLNQQFRPQPFCQLTIFNSRLIENYKYIYGLIQFESWIKIDYNLNINYSASAFGIDMYFKLIPNYYQKLIDLQYCIIQAWKQNLTNGVYFQTYYQKQPDFTVDTDQFFYNQKFAFHTLEQDLRQWHFVSLIYGFDKSNIPVSHLKMWFNDEYIYEVKYNNRTFHFDGATIKIRSGTNYGLESNGIYFTIQKSRITTCIPQSFELIKKCDLSCLDCNGPYFDQCLSCDLISNRYLENNQCKCNLGFIESNEGNCILLKEFYSNSNQTYVPKNQTLSKFGFFPIQINNQSVIYQPCPQFKLNQFDKIHCIECLSEPESFTKNLKCQSDYIFSQYGQYELIKRSENDNELYYLDIKTSSLILCLGCKSYCNPQIDQDCYFNNLLLVYITCLPSYYYNQGLSQCQMCHQNCQTCRDFEICTSCYNQMALNPQNNNCVVCPKLCLDCEYNFELLQCKTCIEKYSLYQGQCIPCGKYCLKCIYLQDERDGSYYNKCIICLDNAKYFLSLNGIDCQENFDPNCLYKIQFHKSWFMRNYVSTIFHTFSRGNFSTSEIINYCALCSEGYATQITGECIRIDQIQQLESNLARDCSQMFIIESSQAFEFNQTFYKCTSLYQDYRNYQFAFSSNGCYEMLLNCVICLSSYCLQCYPGYYTELQTGQCLPCPQELNCYRCQQDSKKWKNGWKINYKSYHYLTNNGLFHIDVFGNVKKDELEILCKTCTIEYEFYQDQCIKKCAENCELCIKKNGQNQCVKCKIYEGRRLSLYEGNCIDCPRYCQICKPKTISELQRINPYYSNEKLISSTHTCLMLELELNSQDYYYNTQFQQFLKLSTTEADPNQIILKFNLFCSLDKFNQEYQKALNKQLFLNQNVRIDELLTNNKSQSNFGRIENLNLYTYLSIQQIQEVELQFTLTQDCVVDTQSYIFTTLTQNIYFINSAKLTIQGMGNTLFLQSNLEIFNFDKIKIENITIQLFQITYLHFQSLNLLETKFLQVTLRQNQEDSIPIHFQLLFTNLNQLTIQNFTLLNLNLQSVQSLFQFEYLVPPQIIQIYFNLLIIQNSRIQNSDIIKLEDNAQQLINFQMHNVLIENSNFNSSRLFVTLSEECFNITGTISQIFIQSSYFENAQPFIVTYCIRNLTIQGIILQNSQFQNISLFQATLEQYNSEYSIKSCNFYNSSIIVSGQNLQFQYIILNNIEFTNVLYDQSTILINLNSNDKSSKTLISNLILDTVSIYSDINLSLDQLSIIFIQSDLIEIYNASIIRSQSFAEFSLSSATYLVLQNITINLNPKYFFKSIITDNYCSKQNDNSKYRTSLFIQKVYYIKIKDISIVNLIIFDSPIIHIISIATSVIRRFETIMIENIDIIGCIIQKNQLTSQASAILITSEQQLEITIKNSQIKNNKYHSFIKESESDSALALVIISYFAKISLISCQFIQNYISQSQNSLIYINSEQINIVNSTFISNNRMLEDFLKHILWKFTTKQLTINQIQTYFSSFSLSGNGNLLASQVKLNNITIQDSFSMSAGCFKITLKNEGEILIYNSVFKNINTEILEEPSYGGCFYIIDQTDSIKIEIQSSIFQNIYGTAEGGVIYLRSNTKSISLNFSNLTIIDTYSNDGNIAKLNLLNSNQQFSMQNCIILQTIEGYLTYRSKLNKINQQNPYMISISSGDINLANIFVKLYLTSFLQLTSQNKVSLTQIEIDNSYYYQSPIILVEFSVDQISKIEINNLKMNNFKSYNEDQISHVSDIRIPVDESIKLIYNCSNQDGLQLKNQTYKIINQLELISHPFSIQSLIQITNVKSSDQILIKLCSFSNNQCSNCHQGLIFIKLIEEQANNIILQNNMLMDNQCGQNGCLYFFNEIDTSRYINNSLVKIDTILCYRNTAIIGGCIVSNGVGLSIQKSIFSENQAYEQGGSIFFKGDSKNLQILNNLIVSNSAKQGGAIYLGEYCLPDLIRTQNFLLNNTAQEYGSVSSSKPNQLTLKYRDFQYQTFNFKQSDFEIAYLTIYSESQEESILKLPSGQKISSYQYFNISSQEYQNLNLKFRVIALNPFNEQQFNLKNSECFIESGYKNPNQDIIYTNNLTSYTTKSFDQKSQDYNFDDLILYYGNTNNDDQLLILKINCNSILIPNYNDYYPYDIINYNQKYFLILSIQTFPCQLGEYINAKDNSCNLCDVEKKLYSVTLNATFCKYMDEKTTTSIKPAQLELKYGYWRPFINSEIIEFCSNRIENCQGGWQQGDKTCQIGQIGACCESCDYYNSRGFGKYSIQKLYQCQKCEEQSSQVLYILLITLWNLFSIYLTTQGIQNMILELQRYKVRGRQLLINSNKQTGPLMKMFTNYLQILAIILNFNTEIPQLFQDSFSIFGQSQQMLLITTDCFLAENFQSGLIYVKIIYSIICPFFLGLVFLFIYFILNLLDKIVYNKVIITTCILYLFCYFQIQVISLLVSTLSYRTLSDVKWIQADLAYQFESQTHQQSIPFLILLSILIGAIVPCILVFNLVIKKEKLQQIETRKQLGYLFLEYQPKAYYWEIIRIICREMIIVTTTFYQDRIVIKCSLLFLIIFTYFQTNNIILPFQTKSLNNLEQRSSLCCTFTLLVMFSLTATINYSNILLAILIIPNVYLFLSFVINLIKSYIVSLEGTLDKIKDIIRQKFQLRIKYNSNLQKWLINKGQRRKVVFERFQSIKKQILIMRKSRTLSLKEKQKYTNFTTKFDDDNIILLRPQSLLSTNSENSCINDPKINLIQKISNIKQRKQI